MMRRTFWLSMLILFPVTTYSPAAEPIPTDVAEIRSRTVELRAKYRRLGTDLEAREAIITEAIRLGPDAATAIHRMAKREGESALEQYGKAFYAATSSAERKMASVVLASNDALQAQRKWLIELVGITAPLKAYVAREEEEKEQLDGVSIDDLLETPDLSQLEAKPEPAQVDPTAQRDEARQEFDEYLTKLEASAVEQWLKDKNLAELDTEELQAIELTNKQREKAGLPPLKIDLKLCLAARDHSADMQRLNFFAHESPVEGKKTYADRARRFGGVAHGENIARHATATAAVDAWMKSPGHKANILNSGYTRIGLGRQGNYFTQVFGR